MSLYTRNSLTQSAKPALTRPNIRSCFVKKPTTEYLIIKTLIETPHWYLYSKICTRYSQKKLELGIFLHTIFNKFLHSKCI